MEFRNCWGKINLSLRVVGRLRSGYHELCSIFFKIGPVDCLTINESVEDNVRVIFSRTKSGIQGRNILLKTLDKIRAAGIAIPPLDMRLEKRVPPGTGLGSGSGDAAALLDYLVSAGYPVERFAAEIGADVPFLLSRAPVALARGAGEKLAPLQALSARWRVVVVIPAWRCVTADMFVRLDEYFHDEWKSTSERARSEACQVFDRLVRGEFCGLLPNDFSDLLLREHGEYRALFTDFYRTGAIAWGISGSGSSAFALWNKDDFCGFGTTLPWVDDVLIF